MALFSKEVAPAKPVVRSDPPAQPGGTYIGPGVIIEGTITGSESVLVEGTVRGKVNLAADVRIGAKARIEATVHARNVLVEGRLTGDISADERVELVATASVDGNLKAPKVIVAEGAKLRGSVDMGSKVPREGADAAHVTKTK